MAGGPEEMYREMDHGLEGMYRETEKGFVCAKKRNFSGRHTHFRQQFGHKVAVLIVSSGQIKCRAIQTDVFPCIKPFLLGPGLCLERTGVISLNV